jgi:hypothetical protein
MNINTFKTAVVIMRVLSLQYIISGLFYLTYLPERIYAVTAAHLPRTAGLAQLEESMLFVRFGLYSLIGACLWLYAQPLAKLLATSVENLQVGAE